MKNKKLLSIVLSVLFTAFMLSSYAYAEDDVDIYIRTGSSETVIIKSYYDIKDVYRIKSDGTGEKRSSNVNINDYACVSAKVKDISKLPDGVYVCETGYEEGNDSVFLCNNPEAVNYYNMDFNTAMDIVKRLKGVEGISDIQMYKRYSGLKCYLNRFMYQVRGLTYDEYNEKYFAKLIDKGYNVSKFEYERLPSVSGQTEDDLEIFILPYGFEAMENDGRYSEMYKAMLDILNTELPEGISLCPSIMCIIDAAYDLSRCSIQGDANFDFVIDIYDAVRIAEYLVGKASFTYYEGLTVDFNDDGKIDLYDAIGIAQTLIHSQGKKYCRNTNPKKNSRQICRL